MAQSCMPAPGFASPIAPLADPRAARGIRHPLSCIVTIGLCAVLAGARSIAAIGQWAANAPQPTLARLGARTVCPALGLRRAPSTDTIRRVITRLDPARLTAPADTQRAPFLTVDGKTLRGSALDEAGPAHLLAAMTSDGHVAAQVRVPAKASEIEHVTALLAGLDTRGVIVSGDALHTQRPTARYLVEQAGAHYLLQVKGNQPRLHAQAKRLPWAQAPVLVRTREAGHGRRETRTAKVLATGHLEFPHARQVIRIIRTSTEISSGRTRRKTAYVITDLDTAHAGPELLEHLIRRHWGIEALHYLRDTAFGEDASRVRCGHAPQNMAMLRNLAIPILATLGNCRWISEAIRWVSYDAFTRPLDLIGLP